MKLTRLIQLLQMHLDQKDAATDVRFATGPSTSLEVLSVYPDDDENILWVDIGENEEED